LTRRARSLRSRRYGRRLAKLGFEALAFDFRNFGQSQTRRYRPGQAQDVDVAAAVKLVRRLGARKVFLLGASLGGSAVLTAGATVKPQVDGVVSVSGAADFVRSLETVPRLRASVLYLAGKYDAAFAGDAHRLYDATGSGDKTLILPRGEHLRRDDADGEPRHGARFRPTPPRPPQPEPGESPARST
jgi:dienelactone hydrolase